MVGLRYRRAGAACDRFYRIDDGRQGRFTFWSLGFLAYTLGMRHAFDADHIAAIDNTVRKLMQQKRSPLGVGFYFSLGHSSVVFLMVLAIACSVKWIQSDMPSLQETGSSSARPYRASS